MVFWLFPVSFFCKIAKKYTACAKKKWNVAKHVKGVRPPIFFLLEFHILWYVCLICIKCPKLHVCLGRREQKRWAVGTCGHVGRQLIHHDVWNTDTLISTAIVLSVLCVYLCTKIKELFPPDCALIYVQIPRPPRLKRCIHFFYQRTTFFHGIFFTYTKKWKVLEGGNMFWSTFCAEKSLTSVHCKCDQSFTRKMVQSELPKQLYKKCDIVTQINFCSF